MREQARNPRANQRDRFLEAVREVSPTEVPTVFRLGNRVLGGPDVLASTETARVDRALQPVMGLDGEPQSSKRWSDLEHLVAHVQAGRDIFVTNDEDDILKHREALEAEDVIVMRPSEALALVEATT